MWKASFVLPVNFFLSEVNPSSQRVLNLTKHLVPTFCIVQLADFTALPIDAFMFQFLNEIHVLIF